MNHIENILIAAEEESKKNFGTFVFQHGGFSGTDPEEAKHRMLTIYYRTLWNTIISFVQESVRTEKRRFSLDILLLELFKRGINVDPTCFSTQQRTVHMSDTVFFLEIRKEGIHIDSSFGNEVTLAIDETIIADMMVGFDRMRDKLPDCYEDVCRKLLLEKKEKEILNATAKGLVLDILKEENADLILEGSELVFTVVKNNRHLRLRTCLGSLREDLSDLLENA